MRITVIGASGLIGSKVVDLLKADCHDVIAASRSTGQIITESGLCYTIVRATQYTEFTDGIVDSLTAGDEVRVPDALIQPIPAAAVAAAVAQAAAAEPVNGIVNIGGPMKITFEQMARDVLERTGDDTKTVVVDPKALLRRGAVEGQSRHAGHWLTARTDEDLALDSSYDRDPKKGDPLMATYALIHGGGDVGWYWHLVERELRKRGHRTVAPDLPIEDDEASLLDNAQVVLDAIESTHENGELFVVGHSYGGWLAPIVAERAEADRLVLVAPMIPTPGETTDEMWAATGRWMPHDDSGTVGLFYHDVDPALAADATSRERRQSETAGREPWPLAAWPKVPTHVVIGTEDRFFPADWLRGVVRDRLGIEPDELPTGHTPALSRPRELVDLMESYRGKGAPRGGERHPDAVCDDLPR